jgi:hypothetical protein
VCGWNLGWTGVEMVVSFAVGEIGIGSDSGFEGGLVIIAVDSEICHTCKGERGWSYQSVEGNEGMDRADPKPSHYLE